MGRAIVDWLRKALGLEPIRVCEHQWRHLQTVKGIDFVYVLQCQKCGDIKKVKIL